MPSAWEKPVRRIMAPATAVAMNANRSVSTCWNAPSTLRLRRSAPARTMVAARFTRDAHHRHHEHDAALHLGRVHQAMDACVERRARPAPPAWRRSPGLTGSPRGARPKVKPPPAGRRASRAARSARAMAPASVSMWPASESRASDEARIPATTSSDHEGGDQRERDRQRPAVRPVIVRVHVLMGHCPRMVARPRAFAGARDGRSPRPGPAEVRAWCGARPAPGAPWRWWTAPGRAWWRFWTALRWSLCPCLPASWSWWSRSPSGSWLVPVLWCELFLRAFPPPNVVAASPLPSDWPSDQLRNGDHHHRHGQRDRGRGQHHTERDARPDAGSAGAGGTRAPGRRRRRRPEPASATRGASGSGCVSSAGGSAASSSTSAGSSLVRARAMRSLGRWSISLTSATMTGVSAAAIQVPAIQSCEVTAAADAEAALAITSVRALRRRWRSSSRSRVRGGEAIGAQHSEVGSARMPGPQERDADVVVIGAGLAGLAAAREAGGGRCVSAGGGGARPRRRPGAERGHRRRRTWSRLGAQWIGPTQDRLAALAAELGVETFPTWAEGKNVLERAGRLRRYQRHDPADQPARPARRRAGTAAPQPPGAHGCRSTRPGRRPRRRPARRADRRHLDAPQRAHPQRAARCSSWASRRCGPPSRGTCRCCTCSSTSTRRAASRCSSTPRAARSRTASWAARSACR